MVRSCASDMQGSCFSESLTLSVKKKSWGQNDSPMTDIGITYTASQNATLMLGVTEKPVLVFTTDSEY